MSKRVLVIGLDCAAPQFVFDRWLPELPTIRSLTERGSFGVLRSCDPPITVPAWSVMTSSRSPGSLGFYGFRNRQATIRTTSSSSPTRGRCACHVCGTSSRRAERDVIVLGVPQTYPPSRVKGRDGLVLPHSRHADEPLHVSAGAEGRDRAGRRALSGRRRELPLRRQGPAARPDRGDDREAVPPRRASARDAALGPLLHGRDGYRPHPPRLLALHRLRAPAVRAGQSRTSTRCSSTTSGSTRRSRRLLRFADEETAVLVVSDHGAKRMDGGICVNEWLRREGYLVLREEPTEPTRLTPDLIDWSRTDAWGEGGYYCRLFLNVEGREPEGVVSPDDYERVRTRSRRSSKALGDDQGRPIGTIAHQPEELYAEARGIAPDLLVYFGGLYWRSIGHRRDRDRSTCSRTTPGRTTRTMLMQGSICSLRTTFPPGRGLNAPCTTSRRRCSSSSANRCRPTWRGGACSGRRLPTEPRLQHPETIRSRTRARSRVRLESGWWRGVAPLGHPATG